MLIDWRILESVVQKSVLHNCLLLPKQRSLDKIIFKILFAVDRDFKKTKNRDTWVFLNIDFYIIDILSFRTFVIMSNLKLPVYFQVLSELGLQLCSFLQSFSLQVKCTTHLSNILKSNPITLTLSLRTPPWRSVMTVIYLWDRDVMQLSVLTNPVCLGQAWATHNHTTWCLSTAPAH